MKIHLPVKYKDLTITEGEAIVLGFLLQVSYEHGFDNYYNFNSADLQKMIRVNNGQMRFTSKHTDKLREILYMVQLDEFNWSLKWRDFDDSWLRARKNKQGKKYVKAFEYTIKETRSIAIWSYLMGKLSAYNGVVMDCIDGDIFSHKSLDSSMTNIQRDVMKFERDTFKI